MATVIQATTCNAPTVEEPAALRECLAGWGFISGHGPLEVAVTDDTLHISGEAGFEPYPESEVSHADDQHEAVDQEAFLHAVTPHLAEPLVIHTVSREKRRFPFGATAHIADPATGTVTSGSLGTIEEAVLDERVSP